MTDHTTGGAPTDEERAQAALEQLKSIHAFDLAYEMMIGLVSFGYQKMGLTSETAPVRELTDARLAIELLRANLAVIEREQGEERTRDLHATLAQMQLGYARAVQMAGAGEGHPAAESPAEAPASAAGEGAPPHAAGADGHEEPAAGAASKPAPAEPAAKRPAAKKKPAAKKRAAVKKKPAGDTPPAEG